VRNPANNKIAAIKKAIGTINTSPLSGILAHKSILKQLNVVVFSACSVYAAGGVSIVVGGHVNNSAFLIEVKSVI
jgi:hypothetical protein